MHTINPSRLITLFIPRSFPRTNIFFFFFFLSLCLSLMTLACNSDLPFSTNDENSYWKNFSSFFQDLSLLKFHRFSLSLFNGPNVSLAPAKVIANDQCFELSYLPLFKRFEYIARYHGSFMNPSPVTNGA